MSHPLLRRILLALPVSLKRGVDSGNDDGSMEAPRLVLVGFLVLVGLRLRVGVEHVVG